MKHTIKALRLCLVLIMGMFFLMGEGEDKETKVITGEIIDNPNVSNENYFDGIWEGIGKQSNNHTWSIKITVDSNKKEYKVAYPSEKSGGTLILLSINKRTIEFKEKITYGDAIDGGKFIITKTNDNQASFSWSSPDSNQIASGTLERDAPIDTNPLKVYPQYPVISTEGDLQITSVYSDANGVQESTDDNELFVNYKVENETLISVSSSGYLVANGAAGKTKVTVTMTHAQGAELGSRDIEIEVAEIDVKKIVISPDISLLAQDENQLFSIIGVNGQGPTEVEDDKLSFSFDHTKLSLTNADDAIVTATANEKKGYAFLTPSYTESGNTITGNSAVIEFHTKPNIAVPGHVAAGENADFIRVKNGTIDNLYIAHEKDDLSEIILTSFNFKNANPWSSSTIIHSQNTQFLSPRLFISNDTLTLLALEKESSIKGQLILLTEESNGAWSDKKILLEEVNIGTNDTLNLQTIEDEIFFTITQDKKVSIYKVNGSNINEVFSFDTTSSIKSIDLTQNREQELRMVVAEENKLSYITKQNDTFYTQTISSAISTQQVKLLYTKKNIPIILYSTENGLEKRSMSSGSWSGATKINGTVFNEATFLQNITKFDAVIDRFNNLKLSVIDNEMLYYIKQYKDRSGKDAWRKTKIVTENVGVNSLSMKMDNKNRIKVIYQSQTEKWIDYWAEPQFFKYRDKKTTYTNIEDELSENQNGATLLQRGNIKPTANAGSDITVDTTQTVTLNASSSSDSDGTIQKYLWSENGKALGNTQTVDLQNLSIGEHNIILTITDDRGAVSTDTIVVTITRIAGYPIAVAGDDQKVYANEALVLDASASTDSNGNIQSYLWSKDGVKLGEGATLELSSGLDVGEHTILLTVTDNQGNIDTDKIIINSKIRDAIIGQILIEEGSSGWKTKVEIDALDIGEKSGTYDTTDDCSADLFYVKKEDEGFLFNRTRTAGDNCTPNCQMWVKEDGLSLKLICDGSVNWTKTLTTQKIIDAVKIIENYAYSSNNQMPTLQEYEDARIIGVDSNNLAAVNKKVDDTYYAYVDTTTEIQTQTDKVVNSHNRIKAYADDNTTSLPSVVDYEHFGFKDDITGGNLVAINKMVDAQNSNGVNSYAKVKILVDKVVTAIETIENYAYSSNNQLPTLQDYLDAGVTGVTANNLTTVNKKVEDTYYAYVDTTTEIQALVDNL